MQHTLAIAKRELSSLFFSPVAYVVLGVFGFGTALIFFTQFGPGAPAEMRGVFGSVAVLMIFLVPAISMRLLSEEYRSGTIETLMTLPISDAQVVLGKWLGAMGFLLTLMVPLVILTAVLAMNAAPDFGPIFSGFLGLMMVGGLYLAIGAFASATTQNQIIAFLVTVFIILSFVYLCPYLARTEWIASGIKPALFYLNIYDQYGDFAKGVIDLARVVFFVSGIGLFLFFATLTLQSRRWR
ncbi:MAG: ABC transporter permease subunit [Phycisphaeraceae bacterium]